MSTWIPRASRGGIPIEPPTVVRAKGVEMTGRAISIQNVSMTYGHSKNAVEALSDIELNLERGELVVVVGPSGCGKSTLLKIVAGLVKPSTGTVHLEDFEVSGPVTDAGIVFQQHLLLPWRTALDNVLLQIEARGLPTSEYRDSALELLEQSGLGGFEHKYPGELSGGMAQRVSICRALVHDPPVLLMDEPFGALDAMTRDQMGLDIQSLTKRGGKTVLFITHSIAEAVFLADRVVIISQRPGQIERIVDVDLPRPRDFAVRDTPEFARLSREVRSTFEKLGVLRAAPAVKES
jgi:NitT/TauT family transport system ATP-binding protein